MTVEFDIFKPGAAARLATACLLVGTLPLSACLLEELFPPPEDTGEDTGEDIGEDDIGETDEGSPTPEIPTAGFRVYPRYTLEALSAVVTITHTGQEPIGCLAAEDDLGGYFCSTLFPLGFPVEIIVQRDGFETALRTPTAEPNELITLDVHLVELGGPTGTWSACLPVDEGEGEGPESCAVVCEAQDAGVCLVTACESQDEVEPVATYELYEDLECATSPMVSAPLSCESGLSELEPTVLALRCCCG